MMKTRSFIVNRANKKAVTHVAVFFARLVTLCIMTLSSLSFSLGAQEALTLEQRVKHLEELNETRNKVQADISYQLSELQREVRSLTGQVEDNTFKLKQIQDRQRELYRDIENRLSGLSTQATTRGNVDTKTEVNRKPPVKTNRGNNDNQANDDGNVSREFNAAFALVRSKNYKAAIPAFDNFLQKYPNSSYSDNARFWMGQIYLVQNKLSDAEMQFAALINDFPESSKASAAKLKLADIYLKQDKWSDAKVRYTEVLNNSKGAEQQLARKGLEKIKKAGH
jgi:tol-pal system protein YbgF